MQFLGHLKQGWNTNPTTNKENLILLIKVRQVKTISLRPHHIKSVSLT
ncbi:Uncharacterised protein [Mycobacterium tuberculosis]|nr:Uncharacterised protein [Mycobacterium tuberculosis]